MGLAGGGWGGSVTVRGTTVALGLGTQPGGGEHRQVEPWDGALCAETELNECRSWRELRAAGWGVEGVRAQGRAERTGLRSSGSRSDPRRLHLGC